MSLAVLADHMASKGRGPDSMLIHMSPREVQGLQALAENHGGSLTINPETGLPEAGFLDKLLPAILGFALAPLTAGTSLAFLGATPLASAMTVGALQTLRTGDIGKGLQAGLGAYGGAGLQAGLATAGASTLAGEGIATEAAKNAALEGVTLPSNYAELAARTATPDQIAAARAAASPMELLSTGAKSAAASPEAMGQFAKDNYKSLMYTAGPILADQAVKSNLPTTTTRPGEVRTFSYNPYNQYYTPTGNYEVPVKSAAGGGLMGMNDGGYNPGKLDFTGGGEPVVRMAEGGIAGYAMGGMPNMREFMEATGVTDPTEASNLLYGVVGSNKDTRDWGSIMSSADPVAAAKAATAQMYTSPTGNAGYVKLDDTGTSGMLYSGSGVPLTSDLSRADEFGIAYTPPAATGLAALNNAATNTAATNTAGATSAGAAYAAANNVDVGANINKWIQDNPFATAADINNAIKAAGLTPADVNPYLTANTNISDATRYALSHASEMPGAGGLAGMQANIMKGFATPNLTQAQIDTQQARYGISDDDIKSPLSGGSQIPAADMGKAANYLADPMNADVRAWINSAEGKAYLAANPQFDINDIAYTHYQRYGKWEGRKWEEAAKKPPVTCSPGYRLNAAGTACEPIPVVNPPLTNVTQNTTTNVTTPTNLYTAPSTALPVGIAGNTGPSQIGGGATVNPNGTITTSPRIPGIPVGGFTGMGQVRDAYEAGGGSLGVNKNLFAPKTQDDINARYKLTGGSKAAFDYLTGKTKYSALPVTETGEIMKPYAESVLGVPSSKSSKQYLFDPDTRKYTLNPDFIPISYTDKGEKVYGLSSRDIAAQLPDVPTSDYEKWMKDNNVTLAQIAQALGISLAEAKKRYPLKKSTDTTTNTPADIPAGANGGLMAMAGGGMAGQFNLGGYSDGGRLLRGPGDGVSDSIPATIGNKRPARLADGEFVVPARIVSELGNGSTEAGARKLYAMMDRVQKARRGTVGKGRVAKNSRADKHLPA